MYLKTTENYENQFIFLLCTQTRFGRGCSFRTLCSRLTLLVQRLTLPVSWRSIVANKDLSIGIYLWKMFTIDSYVMYNMDTAEEILLGFTYILQCVSWIGRSHETASNLISVCPNNCSVMPDSSGCTRFCSRWKRLDYCLGDIIYLERHIYIDQVYLDDSCKMLLWML